MTCFAADHRFVGARRLSEKVEGPDFPTLVGKRIAQLGTDAADGASIDSFQRILLDPVEGIAPLYARSIEEIGGPIASFDITKIVSSHGGWELTIRNSTNGRVGIVRLDTEMRPVSGTMIK
jgi:hypothetical protein